MFRAARIRLTLYYTATLAAILLVLGGGLYVLIARAIDREIDESLDLALANLVRTPARELVEHGLPVGRRFSAPPFEFVLSTDVFYVLVGEDGRAIANPSRVDVDDFPLAELRSASGPVTTSFRAGDEHVRVKAVTRSTPFGEVTFIAGRSLESRDYQLRTLALLFAGAGGASLLLAAAGGFWLAGRALVPIRRTLEAQRRFISDASHELRTPTAVIRSNAELLLRHPEQTIEENADHVAAIVDEAGQLGRLVEDLLTLARADEDRLPLQAAPFAPGELVEGLARDYGPLAEARGLRLESSTAPGTLVADRERIRQVLRILLDNAIKYTPAGGRVRVEAFERGGRWHLAVEDSGPGIPPELRERVFERFFRGPEARGQPGSGLGLAIAKSIVEAHGGRIRVGDAALGGARFEVLLPARRVAPRS